MCIEQNFWYENHSTYIWYWNNLFLGIQTMINPYHSSFSSIFTSLKDVLSLLILKPLCEIFPLQHVKWHWSNIEWTINVISIFYFYLLGRRPFNPFGSIVVHIFSQNDKFTLPTSYIIITQFLMVSEWYRSNERM